MIDEKEVKVAIYTRVSTEEQVNKGHSLEEQERIIRSHCEIYNYKIYKVYSDKGLSGKETTKRKEFNNMMSDMKKKKFDKVIALKLDRMTRDLFDFIKFTKTTDKYKCGFEFVMEKFDTTTPSGRMILNILGVFAQFERELIRERTTIGLNGALNKGHYGGPIPLGYRKEKDNKLFLIDEETAPIVKEVFDLCLKGKTYYHIAQIMKKKYGDMTYNRRDKVTGETSIRKKAWSECTIGTILNNKIYYGVWEHKKKIKGEESKEIKGFIPPIITEEVFNECQEALKRNSRNYYRKKQYLFLQKLECPKCGRIMACAGTKKPNGKEYLYYKCRDCSTYINEEIIEETLINKLTTLLELYLVLEKDYIVLEKSDAEKFDSNKKIDMIRFALDVLAINRKNINNYGYLIQLWDLAPYELKCKLIFEYLDTIQIKVKKKNKNKITAIEITELKFRKHKIKEFFERGVDHLLEDTLVDELNKKYSVCTYNSRQKADNYIDYLRKKFSIKVIDILDNPEYIMTDDMFRIINIKSSRAVEKDTTLYLELNTLN